MKVTSAISDLLFASIGGTHKLSYFFDTTPGNNILLLAKFYIKNRLVFEDRHVELDKLLSDSDVIHSPSDENMEKIRIWIVFNQQGQAVAELNVWGGRGKYEIRGQWNIYWKSIKSTSFNCIEDTYDHIIEEISDVISNWPDISPLYVADMSISDVAAFNVSVIINHENGIYEFRRYNPETLKVYPEPQEKLIRKWENKNQ